MADGGIPSSLAGTPEYKDTRREASRENREDVHDEQLERLAHPEIIKRPRSPEEVIHMVENFSWEEMRERRIEQGYGRGRLARFRAFLAGEYDVEVDEHGDVRHNRWTEFGRRVLTTVFNRRTLLAGGALAAVSVLTGGAGLAAYGAFFGGVAGAGAAETWQFFKGKEREARQEELEAEREHVYDMKRMGNEYQREVDPEKRLVLLKGVLDRFHNASEDALSKRVRAAKVELEKTIAKQKALRDGLQLAGAVGGLFGGLALAKYAALHGGLAGGHLAFGGVDTDLNGVLHDVANINGQWDFVYNNANEALAATRLGADVLPMGEAGQWGHIFGDAPWKIYAYATAKALPVLGVLGLASYSDKWWGGDKGREEKEKKDSAQEKSYHEQVMEKVEGAKVVPPLPEVARTPDVGETFGVGTIPPGTLLAVVGLTAPITWDPAWRYARVKSVVTEPTTKQVQIDVEFYNNESDLRNGSAPAVTHKIPQSAYIHMRQLLGEPGYYRPVTEGERRSLEDPKFKKFFEGNEGNAVQFFGKVTADKLKIVVNKAGWPLQKAALNAKDSYKMESFDLAKNIAELRNTKTGDAVYVDLMRFKDVAEKFVEPAAAEEADKSKKATDPEMEDIKKELRAKGEAEPTVKSVWILPATTSLEGAIPTGDDKGDMVPLIGGSYQVMDYRRKDKVVLLKSLVDDKQPSLEVGMADFVKNLSSEGKVLERVFAAKAGRGEDVPTDRDIRTGQKWEYQHPTDAAPVPPAPAIKYEVTKLQDGQVEITLLNPFPPYARTKVKKSIDRSRLAENGTFIS